MSEDKSQLHILAAAEHSEEITDTLAEALSDTLDQVKIISLRVEALIPAPEETEQISSPGGSKHRKARRVSRDELYSEVKEMIRTSYQNTALTMLSAVVAAIGLARNNVAMIIGAMVIAPLLGPNVGLSLAATLGDLRLGLQALKENFLRIGVALLFAVLVGIIFSIDPDTPELFMRTQVEISDVAVAFSAGAAGALALTVGAPTGPDRCDGCGGPDAASGVYGNPSRWRSVEQCLRSPHPSPREPHLYQPVGCAGLPLCRAQTLASGGNEQGTEVPLGCGHYLGAHARRTGGPDPPESRLRILSQVNRPLRDSRNPPCASASSLRPS